ncbi:MAG TPA: glycosyltransferase family 2 protein [Gaiellaceae bacterium]|nr:glycosyltransferase family 2 protein [Gaiellaceae bacterium]
MSTTPTWSPSPVPLSTGRADISIVVPVHDDRCNLARCLEALAAHRHELIVVDSGSRDGSPELVRSRFPSARCVALGANRGYAAAANAGLELASGRYVLLLNSDARPIGDAVERLVALAEARPDVGVAGPRLVNPDGTLQRSVRGFPTLWRLATEFLFLRKLAPKSRALNAFYGAGFDHGTPADCDFLKGAALLLRREALDEVGVLDEAFFVFSEDVDLCYRMRAAGWKVAFVPDAVFVHVGGTSTRPRWDRMYREQLRGHLVFFAKHHGLRRAERARRIMLAGLVVRVLLFGRERRPIYRAAAAWLASNDVPTLLRPLT